MLVLSRKENQSIKIDKNITITLISISGNQARIGIDAPPEISVHREEIFEQIQAQQSDEETIQLSSD